MKSDTKIAPPAKLSTSGSLAYRLSVGTLIAAGLLLILGYVSFVQNSQQQASLDEQSRKTGELVQQVKDLSEQNKKLSQLSVNYQYCNAQIFAKHTRDNQAIEIEDLEKCVINSFPKGEGAPTVDEIRNMMNQANESSSKDTNSSSNLGSNPNPQIPSNQNPTTPEAPKTPQQPTPIQNKPTNNLLTLTPSPLLPGLQLNTPCLQVATLLGTCPVF